MTTTIGRPPTEAARSRSTFGPGSIALFAALIALLGWWVWTVARGAPLDDGEHFVLVDAFTADTMTVDPAAFLTGDEATAAARADGVIGGDEELPNPFYIRNLEYEGLALDVAADFEAVLIDSATLGPAPVDVDRFEMLMEGRTDAAGYYGVTPTGLPMTVTVEDGQVVSATQQYIP